MYKQGFDNTRESNARNIQNISDRINLIEADTASIKDKISQRAFKSDVFRINFYINFAILIITFISFLFVVGLL